MVSLCLENRIKRLEHAGADAADGRVTWAQLLQRSATVAVESSPTPADDPTEAARILLAAIRRPRRRGA